mmetsp:Transcript_17004/g.49254  ORF Transcript_17004/g.49254 Transcript_17004/m.49254 type:complete len:269 (+) Transcript_17004:1-807(+)
MVFGALFSPSRGGGGGMRPYMPPAPQQYYGHPGHPGAHVPPQPPHGVHGGYMAPQPGHYPPPGAPMYPQPYAPYGQHPGMPPQQVAPAGPVVVRMRGLPFSATDMDVANFFAPLRPIPGTIILGRNASGQPSGEAHVTFATDADARLALTRNRQMMGNRYIELFQMPPGARPGPPMPYGNGAAPGMGHPPMVANSPVLKLRGMPYTATVEDVVAFFMGYGVTAAQVQLGPQPGHAIVRFNSPPEAQRALAEKNHAHMGARYIELFPGH